MKTPQSYWNYKTYSKPNNNNMLHHVLLHVLRRSDVAGTSLQKLWQFGWMGEFCLLVELHREGSLINGATPYSWSSFDHAAKCSLGWCSVFTPHMEKNTTERSRSWYNGGKDGQKGLQFCVGDSSWFSLMSAPQPQQKITQAPKEKKNNMWFWLLNLLWKFSPALTWTFVPPTPPPSNPSTIYKVTCNYLSPPNTRQCPIVPAPGPNITQPLPRSHSTSPPSFKATFLLHSLPPASFTPALIATHQEFA